MRSLKPRRPRKRRPETESSSDKRSTVQRLGLLGLARRAGRIVIGTHAVTAAARKGRLALLVVAEDASANAVSRLGPEAREAPRLTVGSREDLGRAVGRGEVAVIGMTDAALAKRMLEKGRTPPEGDKHSGAQQDPGRQVP